MAITIDDFSKIWASTSPLTPYSFSESNYKEGWIFIGGTPPSRQMWDFLQKQNDEKLKYLLDNFDDYLPLAGGTMTGAIKGNPLTLTADDGNDSADFVLSPNGNATINGNGVLTNPIAGFGARQIDVFNDYQVGKFTLSEPSGTWGMCVIVAFSSPTNDTFNRIFMVRGYWQGGTGRVKYTTLIDNTDGAYTVAIDPNSDTVTFTTSSAAGIYGVATILSESPLNPITFTFA